MRCKECDYRLWNLRSRRCPECGTPFRPGEHEFVANSVQFCCPHCGQGYYGSGPAGHLDPSAFDCVSCDRHIHMDEMVLLPAAGVDEEQTGIRRLAWLDRKGINVFKAWLSAVGMALVKPAQMIRAIPPDSSVSAAIWFAVFTHVLVVFVMILPVALIGFVAAAGGVSGGRIASMLVGIAGAALAALAALIVFLFVWSLVSHGILRLTGGARNRLGRTVQALGYSSGANAVSATPCVGIYFGWIWWLVSAVIMVKDAHRVHGGRAALAVLTLPVFSIGSLVGLYLWFLFWAISAAGPVGMAAAGAPSWEAQSIVDGLRACAEQRGDRWPAHAIELLNGEFVPGLVFDADWDADHTEDIQVGDMTLTQFTTLATPAAKQATVRAAIDALPKDVIAHRLGDWVFTYHGTDASTADPRLWVVVLSRQSDTDAARAVADGHIVVGLADGSVRQIPATDWEKNLAAQNRLRAAAGLAELPNLPSITHDRPASPRRSAGENP